MTALARDYLGHLGLDETAPLEQIHYSHLQNIPFDNLAIHLGEGVSLEIKDISEKLLNQRRGGYCFEHNLLSQEVLTQLGYTVRLHGARVYNPKQLPPVTHLVLEVTLPEGSFLYDVGFGGGGILYPLAFDGRSHEQAGYNFRLEEDVHQWVLRRNESPLYFIQKSDFYFIDCLCANHYTSTYPDSPFVKTLTFQKFFANQRLILRKQDQLWRKTLISPEKEEVNVLRPQQVEECLHTQFNYPLTDKVLAMIYKDLG
jgi:N-hydroxyarylamine O-acetyltransferase